tara:strand:+ start:114 stop:467 length:354 start_codon:yes stop_codon:yes gene_type:complete
MTSLDLKDTIKKIIDDYINPVNPLYRVTYIDSWIEEDVFFQETEDEQGIYKPYCLKNKITTRVMECKPLNFNQKIKISSNGYIISPELVREINNNNIIIDHYSDKENIIILKVEQIA